MNGKENDMENNTCPLVSIAVITYNSSKYVIETLESIKDQIYQNIELIISDDCSTDNTVQKCQEWIEKNKSRFVRTCIIESPVNTGVSANLNRAFLKSKGNCIKSIAGDDLLLPECINKYMVYAMSHPDFLLCFAKMKIESDDKERTEEINSIFNYSIFDLSVKEQYHRLVYYGNTVPAVTCFINLYKWQSLGIEFDERIPMIEDWPMWIYLTRKGIRLESINDYTVKYRIHNDALTSGSKCVYNPSIVYSESLIYAFYRFKQFWHAKQVNHQYVLNEYEKYYQQFLKSKEELRERNTPFQLLNDYPKYKLYLIRRKADIFYGIYKRFRKIVKKTILKSIY